ncbi:hypothetical protein JS533_009185 [Bifidobacterium amazonense]|uniref:Uncharacterized protein n=1 Tax=Bifidobacterium amazonense TaxID=2809027 RepID=A0ABS9VWF3_9BIFI|nr:hypothetical protein [Bifidobacterium amazonense]MCH9276436.1 hypothetical protein [Bifidobacterium amazonense]
MDTINRIETIRDASSIRTRISLTDLNRGTAWRSDLANNGILEVMDRNDTTAYILTPQALYDLVDEIRKAESAAETLEIGRIFADRPDDAPASSGDALAEAALREFATHSGDMMKFVNATEE